MSIQFSRFLHLFDGRLDDERRRTACTIYRRTPTHTHIYRVSAVGATQNGHKFHYRKRLPIVFYYFDAAAAGHRQWQRRRPSALYLYALCYCLIRLLLSPTHPSVSWIARPNSIYMNLCSTIARRPDTFAPSIDSNGWCVTVRPDPKKKKEESHVRESHWNIFDKIISKACPFRCRNCRNCRSFLLFRHFGKENKI